MSETGPTRRRLLGAGLGAAALAGTGGCGLFGDDPEPPPAPDALQPVLDEALALAAAHERAAAAQPGLAGRLTPLAADHRAHADALARLIGTSPAGAAAPGPSGANAGDDVLAALRTAEQAAQRTAAAACKSAPADRAGLVGSIAACRATHAEALR
ncbi:hypothetical protein ACQP2F_39535 [Actinoplanes sp. CA-030573]|uniref:hypothetical protein n=1 Tax=Actinoplanes sp. CA-030573 TaxID=3239898 RepID=UPI003D9372D6